MKRLESNMQIMMQSLANLANIVPTQSPMGRSQSHADSRVTQENIGVKTNRICLSPFQVTKKKNNQKRDKKTQKDSDNKKLKRKLFTVTVGGKDCPLRAVLEPLHGTKYDGLNESVAIPQWIPMVFNVPFTMVLDDVQSLVAAYIFGVNKDTLQHGKEVLIKAGGDKQIFGDRRTLKSLVPRGLVDQEVILT
ncbi:hypothetical protein Fmac_028438 [Flemingia macrophylla]|uniref:Uncharacterized protein n=1 Tax=Flemingia macrophylla TaxID=520843 RepID=A0ABD1L7I2_9FABA